MKSKRHIKILEIIKEKNVETQEELAMELRKAGYEVTQATVSRDIKDLKLIKMQAASGKYGYVAPKVEESYESDKLIKVLSALTVSVENIDKMVVVKTVSAGAAPVAEAIDGFGFEDVAGSIAGENTVFIMLRTLEGAKELVQNIQKYIS
ncbi:arginine repressor [uncultured Clostridium sp.]|uniref:arginine repressor n=1 Tax=uncultured Clostridium sp. TaxID=59620 RepID=UPI0025D3EA21|nr:arginine repressor [uncultured Clostridium sp.]